MLSARLPLLQSLIRAPPSLSVLSARMPLSCRASHDFSSSIGILGSLFLPFQTQGTLLSYSESHLRAPAFWSACTTILSSFATTWAASCIWAASSLIRKLGQHLEAIKTSLQGSHELAFFPPSPRLRSSTSLLLLLLFFFFYFIFCFVSAMRGWNLLF